MHLMLGIEILFFCIAFCWILEYAIHYIRLLQFINIDLFADITFF